MSKNILIIGVGLDHLATLLQRAVHRTKRAVTPSTGKGLHIKAREIGFTGTRGNYTRKGSEMNSVGNS